VFGITLHNLIIMISLQNHEKFIYIMFKYYFRIFFTML